MLTPDVTFEDFAQEDWRRLVGLFGGAGQRPDPPSVGVVALTHEGRLRKLLVSDRGAVSALSVPWPATPSELSERFAASWAVVLERGALDDLMGRWVARLSPEQELTAQCIEALRVARELEAEGRIITWPRRIASVPLLSEAIVARALDLVCADGKALMIGAYERGEVSTAIVAQRHGEGFGRIVGPERLRMELGLSSGDWTRDCHRLARAAELSVGQLALGVFGEVATLRRVFRDREPGAWATAVARRDIVLHPVAPAVAVPLGVDVGRAAYRTMRGLANRIAGSAFSTSVGFGPAFDRVWGAMPGQEDLTAWLGFDPMRLLRQLLEGDSEPPDRR